MNMEGPASQGTDGPVPFTPGPWRAEKGEHDSWNVLYDDKENDLVGPDAWEVAQVHPACAGADAEGNAALIAAAPEMYEALKLVRDFNEGRPPYRFTGLSDEDRANEAHDAWWMIKAKVDAALAKALNQPLTAR